MADILSTNTKVEASHVLERPGEGVGQPHADTRPSATIEPSLQPTPAATHPASSDADDSGYSDTSEWSKTGLVSVISGFLCEVSLTYLWQDLQNALFEMSMGGKLVLAPVKVVHNCLDVGTGTGIWAIDFGDEHPESRVIGVDLSPIQPTWVPPNVQFFVDDVEDPWHYQHQFDLIHSRMMVGSFNDWPAFINNAFTWTRPNGYLELQDVDNLCCDDGTLTVDPPSCRLAEWYSLVVQAFKCAGRPMDVASKHKEHMLAAGFVDVQETVVKWPINTWPKDEHMKKIGLFSCENTSQVLEAFAMAPLTRYLGWTKEEVQVLVAGARADIKNTGLHAYWTMWVPLSTVSFQPFILATKSSQPWSDQATNVTFVLPLAQSHRIWQETRRSAARIMKDDYESTNLRIYVLKV